MVDLAVEEGLQHPASQAAVQADLQHLRQIGREGNAAGAGAGRLRPQLLQLEAE